VLATRDVRPERSIGELFSQLTQDVGTLVRQEAALARTEIRDKVSHVTGNAGGLAIGGFIAFVGALALTAALILGLAELGVAPWLSALIVGALMAGGGYLLLQKSLAELKDIEVKPKRTIETLKDDVQWAKELRP